MQAVQRLISPVKQILKASTQALGFDLVKLPKYVSVESLAKTPKVAPKYSKIQYGCGDRLLKDWINVDWYAPATDGYEVYRFNLALMHPFQDSSFAFGHSEDFIEHLTQADALIFLSEVYRTFKIGGVLRLVFPGLENVLKVHYPKTDLATSLLAKKEAYEMWGHHHFFSKEELNAVCKHLGFSKVEFKTYQSSNHPELQGLEQRESQEDINTFAEITK